MRSNPKTFLLGDYKIAIASEGQNKYGHTFGGPHDRRGGSRDDSGGILIHLLHRFNLEDPKIPISIPGVQWLPFYYCFDFRANEIGYRLVSDDEMIVSFVPDEKNVSKREEWPDDNYPSEFPSSKIEIAPFKYDPADMEDAYMWAGIFGIERLSEADREVLKKRVAKELDEMGFYPPETEEEFDEAFDLPFYQGKPHTVCLNPDCSNHTKPGQLSTIALMPAEPIKGVHTFGRYGSEVQLIFQLCGKCHTIHVSNECT